MRGLATVLQGAALAGLALWAVHPERSFMLGCAWSLPYGYVNSGAEANGLQHESRDYIVADVHAFACAIVRRTVRRAALARRAAMSSLCHDRVGPTGAAVVRDQPKR